MWAKFGPEKGKNKMVRPTAECLAKASSGWTLETLQIHQEALAAADKQFAEERDRRYSEVNTEREKALKIKETADLAALSLAREIQSYKDEKANQLREQISGERGSFATKDDLAAAIREVAASIAPLTSYVQSAGGASKQSQSSVTMIVAIATVVNVFVVAVGVFATVLAIRWH
jgi:vacuolar-type H+-ATPase subunit H